jgi:hypothetical protein
MNINYLQTIPDSQYFTRIDQILQYAIWKGDKYLETAVKNTIEKSYKLGLFNINISDEPINGISFDDLKKLLEKNVTIDINNFIKGLKEIKKNEKTKT